METLSFTSNPLSSSIVTLYILIILYSPHFWLTTIISFSPLLVSTLILLLFLLRLGASQQLKSHNDPSQAEPPTSSEPEPESKPEHGPDVEGEAEEGAKAEPLCNRVETRSSTESGPGPEPEPVGLDQGMVKQSAKAEPYSNCVETGSSTQPGPGPGLGPEPDWCDEGWADFDCSKLGKEEEVDKHCNCVETRPATDSGPGPEHELENETKSEPEEDASARSRAQDWQWSARTEPGPSNMFCREWEVGAPLEVIYEAYEGEEDEEEGQNDAFNQNNQTSLKIERYPSLSRYYPESGSDSDSDSDSYLASDSSVSSWDGEFPRIERWHEEEGNEMIEIALNNNNNSNSNRHGNNNKGMKKLVEEGNVVDVDEDNLIEIDISPTQTSCEFSW